MIKLMTFRRICPIIPSLGSSQANRLPCRVRLHLLPSGIHGIQSSHFCLTQTLWVVRHSTHIGEVGRRLLTTQPNDLVESSVTALDNPLYFGVRQQFLVYNHLIHEF